MSGGGDGGGFFEESWDSVRDIGKNVTSGKGNFFENFGRDFANYMVSFGTAGILNYEDGKIGKGFSTEFAEDLGKGLESGTKEVTGAKAAEEANEMARQQFEESKVAAEKERADQIAMKGREQIMASQLAGAARRAGTTSGKQQLNLLGTDEKDFLGL